MTHPPGDFDGGTDRRPLRVYEGVVTKEREDNFLDLDHGFEVSKGGAKRHV